MKRKAISRILAISLSVAMCAQSIPIYAAEEIRTSAAADFFAEDSIENQSLNEGDAETNTETNTETNAESNTETNAKADGSGLHSPCAQCGLSCPPAGRRPFASLQALGWSCTFVISL